MAGGEHNGGLGHPVRRDHHRNEQTGRVRGGGGDRGRRYTHREEGEYIVSLSYMVTLAENFPPPARLYGILGGHVGVETDREGLAQE